MPEPTRLRTVRATRYVTPLREGGSMPGLVEADDDGLYVVKFRGAGQGLKALVAEVIVGELARACGLRAPELVIVEVDPLLAAAEPDPEIQELVAASGGTNAGLDFLPGALPFSPAAPVGVTPELAAEVVWLDALCQNVDRTPRNPNMLIWHGDLWLIDHGAALYFHHGWRGGVTDPARFAVQPWELGEHVLSAYVDDVPAVDEAMAAAVTDEVLTDLLAAVPDEWLVSVPGAETPDAVRAAYHAFLVARRDEGRPWLPRQAAA